MSGRLAPVKGSLSDRLMAAGFVDVHEFQLKQPFGPWPKPKELKKLGVMLLLQGEQGFHSYGMLAFVRMLGMDPHDADKLCKDAIAATKNKNTHAYAVQYAAPRPKMQYWILTRAQLCCVRKEAGVGGGGGVSLLDRACVTITA